MKWFTADEHYGHKNIIKYCNRPYKSVEEMDADLIQRHNIMVGKKDEVIHAGDFAFADSYTDALQKYISKLNGQHIFLQGSHDRWLPKHKNVVYETTIENQHIVVCHYAMREWSRSHYNSWMLYGHSHGRLPPQGKQWDIGVDNNDFFPLSFEKLKWIMLKQSDNFNKVRS